MSIIGIIGISFVVAALLGALSLLVTLGICDMDGDEPAPWIIAGCITLVFLILLPFIGIGIDTEDERCFVVTYEAQKATIEQSLESDQLTGFERAQIVNIATELNGELANRLYYFNLWHNVHYDNSIYDNVEPKNLGGNE